MKFLPFIINLNIFIAEILCQTKNLWYGTVKILLQDWAMTSIQKELHILFVS